MKTLKIPPRLLDQIAEGNAILFLGAGATYGCRTKDGKGGCPNGTELGIILSDKFLGGLRKKENLAKIADLAISEGGLTAVQHEIAKTYEHVEPQSFHSIITSFKWKAIVTTNYDRVIEKTYSQSKDAMQDPFPVLRNGDMGRATEPGLVPIIKIHGCISQAGDTRIPLVISNEQYVKYKNGRERLAISFEEMAKDHPVIFCGYNIGDRHIEAILFSLEDEKIDRPHYIAINPAFDELDARYWAKYRLTTFSNTFEEFLTHIDNQIPKNNRALSFFLKGEYGSISRWLKAGRAPSRDLQGFMGSRVTHVHPELVTENSNAQRFYRGDSRSWAPISDDLDFRRSITTQLLSVLLTASGGAKEANFFLLRGHAGSGKSVAIRRLAWEASSKPHSKLCLFLESWSEVASSYLDEICEITGERLYLFIDNALHDIEGLKKCVNASKKRGLPVTIVAAARVNEWNIHQAEIGLIPDEEFTIGNLSPKEARDLCLLLERHNCLGELLRVPFDERVARFMEVHDRQLLVALHEATGGKPLREIVLDEYKNLAPPEARVLYLDICSLHRLGAPVRAGLISRISGIRFETFKQEFLSPMEKVVAILMDYSVQDYVYKSRHRDIAQIVFEEVLPTPSHRANQIIRVVGSLNAEYSSDKMAASILLKGRKLADDFADRSLVDRIFDAAFLSGLDEPFLLQQRAIFELNHPGGSKSKAMALINQALEVSERSTPSLFHTKAVTLKMLAREDGLEQALRFRYREDALDLLRKHCGTKNSYTASTKCEILLDQVKDRIKTTGESAENGRLSDQATLNCITALEQALTDGLQRFPMNNFLVGIKAELRSLLSDAPRALEILRAAFIRNPGSELSSLRLARQLADAGNIEEAIDALRKASKVNAASKALNFELASLLSEVDEQKHKDEIGKALRRSYTDGDVHFEAQFWAARHEFLFGDRSRARRIYDSFRTKAIPYVDATKKRGIVKEEEGSSKIFRGEIRSVKGDFAFISCTDIGEDVYLHRTEFASERWEELRISEQIVFYLGFSFRGAVAVNAQRLS